MIKIFKKITSNYKIIVVLFSIFFFLFGLYFESVINSFGLSFNFLFFSENSAEWFQVLGGVGSFIVAIVVGYLAYKFNKNSEIQNKLAFEEFRPLIKLQSKEGYPIIVNDGKFEASNIIYCYKYYDENKRKYSDLKVIKDYESLLLSPGAEKRLNIEDEGYYSYVILYKNFSSGILYINGFNFKKGGYDLFSIGDLGKDDDGIYSILSPIEKNKYIKIINEINPQNQIFYNFNKNKVDSLINYFFNLLRK
ncbi:hypothetical protein [Candidatus Vampirococcus lugosii]|uniref:Uncharacterized protein n=1 Tax=Candidatus Vampirococcus lugosii TaxID=2789015 RepID=A0ABS5QMB1_9BACT|nr:hypothetical protein [Candidatus Vampirococcus lugosii]MBS8121898.1 hypothetical protein [Candidatus Vampirococcus lugosii]